MDIKNTAHIFSHECTHLHTRTLFAYCRTINLWTDAIVFEQLFRRAVNTFFKAIRSIYTSKKGSYTSSAPIRASILPSRRVNSERFMDRRRFRQPDDPVVARRIELVAAPARYSYFSEFAWNRSRIDHVVDEYSPRQKIDAKPKRKMNLIMVKCVKCERAQRERAKSLFPSLANLCAI